MTKRSRELTDEEAQARRIAIDRELAELVKQAQVWYLEWVKPNAAAAGLMTPGGKTIGPAGASVNVLSLELADRIDVSTPTGKFEKGRAYMAHLDARITALRKEKEKLARPARGNPQRRPYYIQDMLYRRVMDAVRR